MKYAETVTFGGSGLDRAAEKRNDAPELLLNPAARATVFWRGKPLIGGDDRDSLALLAVGHEILKFAQETPIFLGMHDGAPCFAYDVSRWQPDDLDDAQLNTFLDPSEQHHPSLPVDQRFSELRAVMTQLNPRDAELAASAKAVMNWHASHRFCAKCGQPTKMAMGGWQRDCAACDIHHFPRTDPVVIMLITHGNSVLMGRSPGWPEGMYSLLAGFVEPGETLEAAVRREVFEEAGVRVGEVGYLASQPWPFPASLMFGARGTAISHQITIDPVEIEDALWVTREEMVDVFAGEHPLIKPAREGAIAHFLLQNWLADRLE